MSGACSFESSNNVEAEVIGKRKKRVDKSSEPTKKRRRTLPDLNEPALPDLNKFPPPEYSSDDEEQATASSVAHNSDYDELPCDESMKRESGRSSNLWGKFKSWIGMSKNKKDSSMSKAVKDSK